MSALALEPWTKQVKDIRVCRICGSRALEPVIDLGRQAVAGLFNDGRPQNQSERLPLEVVRCAGGCGFVQLRHTVPPSVLYQDYGYRSGINTTMRRHLEALVREVEAIVPLAAGDIVLDIGANDGTTLLAYHQPGILQVAFEPSNIRPEQPDHGLVYIPELFSREAFEARHPGRRAKVITSLAMFYDVECPREFCRQVHALLEDDGIWVLEMSYLGAMLEQVAFDAICHEHLGYYSLQTLSAVVQEAGFLWYDVTFNAANGGSVRGTFVTRGGRRPVPVANQRRIEQALGEERRRGYDTPEPYAQFRESVERIRQDLRAQLEECRRRGYRVYGYGASTKGNVLLQHCGIGPEDLIAIADRNPAKVGRITPGTRIPICSEEQMRAARPEALLVLPWHFLDEFMERERPLRETGTRFIVPMPRVRLV